MKKVPIDTLKSAFDGVVTAGINLNNAIDASDAANSSLVDLQNQQAVAEAKASDTAVSASAAATSANDAWIGALGSLVNTLSTLINDAKL